VEVDKGILLGIVVLSMSQVIAKADDNAADRDPSTQSETEKNLSSASMRRARRKPGRWKIWPRSRLLAPIRAASSVFDPAAGA